MLRCVIVGQIEFRWFYVSFYNSFNIVFRNDKVPILDLLVQNNISVSPAPFRWPSNVLWSVIAIVFYVRESFKGLKKAQIWIILLLSIVRKFVFNSKKCFLSEYFTLKEATLDGERELQTSWYLCETVRT